MATRSELSTPPCFIRRRKCQSQTGLHSTATGRCRQRSVRFQRSELAVLYPFHNVIRTPPKISKPPSPVHGVGRSARKTKPSQAATSGVTTLIKLIVVAVHFLSSQK